MERSVSQILDSLVKLQTIDSKIDEIKKVRGALPEEVRDLAAVLARWVAKTAWADHLALDPATRSNTSVCLQFADRSDEAANAARQKALVKLLETEGAAYDIGAYRDAPPGLRIWCGATVDTADIEALGPWLDWAWEQVR